MNELAVDFAVRGDAGGSRDGCEMVSVGILKEDGEGVIWLENEVYCAGEVMTGGFEVGEKAKEIWDLVEEKGGKEDVVDGVDDKGERRARIGKGVGQGDVGHGIYSGGGEWAGGGRGAGAGGRTVGGAGERGVVVAGVGGRCERAAHSVDG